MGDMNVLLETAIRTKIAGERPLDVLRWMARYVCPGVVFQGLDYWRECIDHGGDYDFSICAKCWAGAITLQRDKGGKA